MKIHSKHLVLLAFGFYLSVQVVMAQISTTYKQFSGIYPHLAYYNEEGECGTGAVVPWADRLWIITYGPHLPYGSSDKLYEISQNLEIETRTESIGGTPANRMIHRESKQLFIGPYAIDADAKVRKIPYDQMPGRHTGNARHLYDPENKIYYGTMEEGFYEVDVASLSVGQLYVDGNVIRKEGDRGQFGPLLPGAHGKGLYSGQGVMVFSNNGEDVEEAKKHFDIEAGALAEWDGKDWKIVRRNQFVEVTGPGGIYGNSNPETDPIWATGWDHRSVILGVRSPQGWAFYRLPKASHSYDGAHGWNTEWPRIRNVGTEADPDYLMTMHGLFWDFPGTFTEKNSAGLRPRSAYLKVIGDFTRWQDQLVFGCDDSAQREFLNTRKAKGGIGGPGQSNSNLWFTTLDKPDQLGPATAEGAVLISEPIEAGQASEPFLFAGWDERVAWISNEGDQPTTFEFEVDKRGDDQWQPLKSITVQPGQSQALSFTSSDPGVWIRVKTNRSTIATVHFSYTDNGRFVESSSEKFDGIATVEDRTTTSGLLYGLGDNRKTLGILAGEMADGKFTEAGYYELDGAMNLVKKNDPETEKLIRSKFAIPKNVVSVDEASVLVVDDQGRRWRLPKGSSRYDQLLASASTRIAREVATERDLLNLHGTFYELPAENADGFAKIRPVTSHDLQIHDYASYRGLLVLTGIQESAESEHIIRSADGKAAVWAGVIDDLWELGKPKGEGGPWKDTHVTADVPSDPYLIGFYDKKTLELSHDSSTPVTFRIEAEPIGHGPWMSYKEITIQPGETFVHTFPSSFQARWIRFQSAVACKATAWLRYE